jgi:hypothetical protein
MEPFDDGTMRSAKMRNSGREIGSGNQTLTGRITPGGMVIGPSNEAKLIGFPDRGWWAV